MTTIGPVVGPAKIIEGERCMRCQRTTPQPLGSAGVVCDGCLGRDRAQGHLDGMKAWARERIARREPVTIILVGSGVEAVTCRPHVDGGDRWSEYRRVETLTSTEAKVLRLITEAIGIVLVPEES